MKLFERLCAAGLFLLAIIDGLIVLKTYTGRIWIFGTCLALLFTAMLNVLCVRNGYAMRGVKLYCITAKYSDAVFRHRPDGEHQENHACCSIRKCRW